MSQGDDDLVPVESFQPFQTIAVERAFALERQPYWLVPFRDLIAFTTFVSGFFGTTVSWRGSRYRVLSDGSVVQRSN